MESINQSTEHNVMSHCGKSINSFDLCFFHCHTIPYHCVSVIAAFSNTEWLKYNISHLPLVSSAKRKLKCIKPDDASAKVACASQHMSIDNASQTVDGNAAAADNDKSPTQRPRLLQRPLLQPTPRPRLRTMQRQRPTPPRFLLLDLRRRPPRPPRPWPWPRQQPQPRHPAGGGEVGKGGGGEKATKRMNLFVLDECIMRQLQVRLFQAGQQGEKCAAFRRPSRPSRG
jgi:hypothetical protein